jgi:hypothetical protein
LNRIARLLGAFKRDETLGRSVSIMLEADPSSGKTLLARSLADAFDLSFIRYDVTQMITRSDLLALFDNVATRQANTDRKVLVFVDEINALLEGSHVYGAFLAPLEEGFYMRHSQQFRLRPCVWVFAGTDLDRDQLEAAEKMSDFKSRMTLIERIDFASYAPVYKNRQAQLQTAARLEQVYLGATMIKDNYPDVREVSKSVLEQFRDLRPEEAPARTILKMATSLRNVAYGKVTEDNCEEWDVSGWDAISGGHELVSLVFEAPQ